MKTKKIISVLFIFTVMVCLMVLPMSTSAADGYSDTSGHWAEKYVDTWSNRGILLGYPDGTFLPNNHITRAEMAIIIDRVVSYTNKSAANTYSDVTASDWYSDAILKLHAAGIMRTTSGKVNPNENITRQEAIMMIAKAFDVYDESTNSGFTDESTVESWALPYVRGMKANKYIKGYEDNSLRPKEVLTRAEVVTILDNMIKELYNTSDTYGSATSATTVAGNVVISSKDVNLRNVTVQGNVFITQGANNGAVDISNSTISGTLYVWSSGSSSIKLNNSDVTNVVLNSANTTFESSASEIYYANIMNGTLDSNASTTITKVDMANGTLNLAYKSDVDTITTTGGAINIEDTTDVGNITAASTKINIKSTATVNKITINEGAGTTLTVNGTLNELYSNITITVAGNGTVTKSNLDTAADVKLSTVVADGSNVALTTKLTLTFDKDIENLSVNDITISANSTGATKGTLTKVAGKTGVYELIINGIVKSDNITVTVKKTGFTIADSEKTVYVYFYPTTNAVVNSITVDGSSAYRSSKITITFDQDIANLNVNDFTITDPNNTGTLKSTLTKVSGATGVYELAIYNMTTSNYITLSFVKSGYTFSTSSAGTKYATYSVSTIYVWYNAAVLTPLTYSVTADGNSSTATTKLTFTFSAAVQLSHSNITITNGTGTGGGGAAKVALTATGTAGVYELTVTPTATGAITVTVTPPTGYTISDASKVVTVYLPTSTTVNFISAIPNGSTNDTTTLLTLNFGSDIPGLSVSNISIANSTGTATIAGGTSLTKTATGVYTLPITVTKTGSITVTVSNPTGYTISSNSKSVNIYYVASSPDPEPEDTNVRISSVTTSPAGGTTTTLTITLDKAVSDLVQNRDITISNNGTGANIVKSVPSAGNTVYTLTIDGVTKSGNITLSFSKSGYTFTNSPYTVAINHVVPTTNVTVNSMIADGNASTTSTKITITLGQNVTGLTASDFSISAGSTGVTVGALRSVSTGVYELPITSIASSGAITVSISKTGYTFSPSNTMSMQVYYVAPLTSLNYTVVADGNSTTATTKLTFVAAPAVKPANITISNGTGSATQGTLEEVGTGVYELSVTPTLTGTITVTITPPPGYTIANATRVIDVYLPTTP